MKKKFLLSSILTIFLCLSLIAGSTFALFTHTSQVNIVATAGNVEMTAGIEITKVESVEGDVNGTIEDENGATYSYLYKDEDGTDGYTFINGGTASVTDSVLTMTEVTPGDKITLSVTGKNDSDIAILYRYKIDCVDGENLMKGLRFTVNGAAVDKYMATYTSPWIDLAKGNNIAPVTITVELPVSAGNIFQNQTTEIRVIVEAIQANAVVEDNVDPVITYYNTAATTADAANFINDPFLPEVNITAPIAETIVITEDLSNKTIYANGNNVAFTFTGKLENVVVDGVVSTAAGCSVNLDAATGDIKIANSTFTNGAGNFDAAIVTGNCDLEIDNCTFEGGKYALYNYDPAGALTVTNSTFKNCSSWAIQVNNVINADVVIDGCTFDGANSGLVKVLSAPEAGHSFTFTNNTVINSRGHDGYEAEWLWVSAEYAITAYGNTLNGAAWAPGVDQGLGR